ncbi:penicillin acylase family protein [Robiginitalea sp. M366]|uniref:penicillin acylase family protein n=1 Tax=Robiginitalea aestuariiviva TaxID=3036903 RepID=UPI00240E884B|nr:penicillin acylase family protein [Robiginitalea aestuariiviva]MDG1572826.1 penicillin acylase family protein [Robiginitalea aestuariiviva]
MKRFRKPLRLVLILVLVLLLAGFWLVRSLKPDYSGDRPLAGLTDSVQVRYDPYGIPHIYAENQADAFRALGYAHAQDRLWQMELLRRVGRGGLSEVFGPDLLPTDRLFLSLGIDRATGALLAEADWNTPEMRLAQAYLDGINTFVEQGPTPPEYYLTGLDKTPFSLRDVYNSIGYMAFSFAMAHKTDPLLEQIGQKLPPAYLQELLDEDPSRTQRIGNYDARTAEPEETSWAAAVRRVLAPLPLPALEGSNSWVIHPSRTATGAVILANDPHIGFAQPSVWFEAHLSTPDYEKYGYHLAGIPFPLLGHDRNLAYGLTMFENDDIDFYRETTDPADSSRYLRPEGWQDFEVVETEIKVKGAAPVTFSYRRTDLGPVMNPVLGMGEGQPPVSMAWTYTQGANRVLQALYGIAHAKDLATFEMAVKDIHAPGLNVMYGDAKGNVAWWAAARLYRLPDSLSTKVFREGAATGPGYAQTLPFADNPKAINPPWGYVYSANNQPDSTAAGYIPGYYLPENRARRIVNLLDSRRDWDPDAVAGMLTDAVSPVNPEIVRTLSRYMKVEGLEGQELPCLDLINAWDGDYPVEGQEGLIYHRWIYYLLAEGYADELGAEDFQGLLATHLHKRLIARMVENPESVWWDNFHTPEVSETLTDAVNTAFKKAIASLVRDFGPNREQWQWGRAHTLEHKHPIGQVAWLRPFFNVGPFPVPATREVINNLAFQYDSTGMYPVTSGPSTRRIVDFSDIENSRSILPTGQSGNPLSPHYDDQAAMYVQGEFRKMMLNAEEIRENTRYLLRFYPAPIK